MKYVVVLCDGMSDVPVAELGGKTPMQAAKKPNMDALAAQARVGLVKTVADGLSPGSDVANLSVLGYDPERYYSGRSSLEAASIGVELLETDITYRCNFVTLEGTGAYEALTITDHSAGDITTQEADELLQAVAKELLPEGFAAFTGFSYRHCIRLRGSRPGLVTLTPPHDITGRVIGEFLPKGEAGERFRSMMARSRALLKAHPVNQKRVREGKNPANSIWFWGEGTKPLLPSFEEKNGVRGAMISAVDLLKGIAVCSGMEVCEVQGATGYLDTNFEGKAQAAVQALQGGADFAFVHLEAPDECGHKGHAQDKTLAIELIDSRVLPILLQGLREMGEHRILILPDHPTPVALRTHTADPVPFFIYDSAHPKQGVDSFTEESAAATGDFVEQGHLLIDQFLSRG